ncbi:hypothetical protein HYX12_01720 [Candidatus Woesearchaeota archaeon]|nr:hypothetical protein [Candidatus Woesearchaeota archaeon]
MSDLSVVMHLAKERVELVQARRQLYPHQGDLSAWVTAYTSEELELALEDIGYEAFTHQGIDYFVRSLGKEKKAEREVLIAADLSEPNVIPYTGYTFVVLRTDPKPLINGSTSNKKRTLSALTATSMIGVGTYGVGLFTLDQSLTMTGLLNSVYMILMREKRPRLDLVVQGNDCEGNYRAIKTLFEMQ